MSIGLMNFQPQSFYQANPLLAMSAANNAISGMIQNQYAPQMAQQALLKSQLQNQMLQPQAQYAPDLVRQELLKVQLNNQVLQPQAQYAPQMTLAELALKRAMPGYYGAMASDAAARAGLTNQQASILRQTAPYQVESAQESVFKDPMLSRMYQIGLAQKTGTVPQDLLSQLGMAAQGNPAQNQPQPVSGASGMEASTAATAPNMLSGSPLQNYLMFGSPLSPYQQMQMQAAGKGMQEQAKANVEQYNKYQQQASDNANLGNQIDNLLDQFQKNYANSRYKGGIEGNIPATGWASAPFRLTGNLAPEQATDNASQNIAASVAKLIAGGRVTNYEMQYINNLKPNRAMDPQTAQMASDFLQQKAKRMQEEQNFYNATRAAGIDPHTANSLWNMYNIQRPVYDFQTNKPNTQYQNTWRDFINPQSVYAVQNGLPYMPGQKSVNPVNPAGNAAIPKFSSRAEFQNWFRSLPPAQKIAVRAQLGSQ